MRNATPPAPRSAHDSAEIGAFDRSDILDVLALAGIGGSSGFSALLDLMTARGEMDQ